MAGQSNNFNQLTEDFLSVFEADEKRYLIEFSKYLSSLNVDVIMLMARKAACIFRCFESLGMTKRPTLVTTDRILAFNTSWLKNKKVAIVDDALISGTTLYSTRNKISSVGADVSVHTLFINKAWHAKKLIKPNHNFVQLSDVSAARLSSNLVDAMSILPRPYSIDYPLFGGMTLLSSDINMLCSIPGWICFDVSTAFQKQHGVFSFTVQPNNIRLRELDSLLGWNISSRSMCKIRIYGRYFDKYMKITILPIVALGPIKGSEIDALYESVIQEYSDGKKVLNNICIQRSAKFQFIQFLMAYKLAEIWINRIKSILPYILSEPVLDIDEVGLLFPPLYASTIMNYCDCKKPLFKNADLSNISFEEPKTERKSVDSIFEIQEILTEKFKKLYFDKELQARNIVKKLGVEAFNNIKWKKLLDRLNHGYTFPKLKSCIPKDIGLDRTFIVSNFLDLSIDRGAIVPISVNIPAEATGEDIYYRAYRHGEEIIVTLREEKLLLTMLNEFLISSGRGFIPPTWMEKLLVLFIKRGVNAGFLNPYYGELRDPRTLLVGVTNYLHGAMTQINIKHLYEFDPSASFCKMLCRKRRLREHYEGTRFKGYSLGEVPNIPVNTKEENLAKRLGRRLGEIAPKIKKGSKAILTIDKLTLMATCLTTEEALLSLAAELNVFVRFWRTYANVFNMINQKDTVCKLTYELRQKNTGPGRAWIAINNGWWKFKASLRQLAKKYVKQIGEYYKSIDIEKYESWYDFWPDLEAIEESEDSKLAMRYFHRAGNLLLVLNILIRIWEYQINNQFQCNEIKGCCSKDKIISLLREIRDQRIKNELETMCKRLIVLDKKSLSEREFFATVQDTIKFISKYTAQSYSILSFIKKAVEPKGRFKEVTYFPYTLGIYFKDLTKQNYIKAKVYEEVDNINKRLLKKVMPKMYRQDQRSISISGIRERLLMVDDRVLRELGLILIAAKGPEILKWLMHLTFRLRKELFNLQSTYYVIFSGLPKLLQPFQVCGDNRLGNSDFDEICSWCPDLIRGMDGQLFHFYSSPEDQNIIYQEVCDNIGNNIIEDTRSMIEHENYNDFFSIKAFNYIGEVKLKRDHKLTDVGIVMITARELRGVQKFFDINGGFMRGPGKQSGRTYLKATLSLNIENQTVTLTATKATQQGQQAIMGAVQALVKEARPKIVVLLGIAGAIDDFLAPGDVVLGDNVIFYEDKVEAEEGTIRRLNTKSVPAWSLDKAALFFADHGDPAILIGKDDDQFKVISAPIGSGEAILKTEQHEIREYLKSMDYRTAVIEKEAAGFLQYFFEESLDKEVETEGVFIIRGISDFADHSKDDFYQEKAAFNCMVALHELLKSINR